MNRMCINRNDKVDVIQSFPCESWRHRATKLLHVITLNWAEIFVQELTLNNKSFSWFLHSYYYTVRKILVLKCTPPTFLWLHCAVQKSFSWLLHSIVTLCVKFLGAEIFRVKSDYTIVIVCSWTTPSSPDRFCLYTLAIITYAAYYIVLENFRGSFFSRGHKGRWATKNIRFWNNNIQQQTKKWRRNN